MAALAIEAAEGWWRQHPLNKVGTVAAKASMPVVKAYAKKEPLYTVAIAAGVTVLVLLLKPWRLLFRPKLILSAATGIALYALKNRSSRDWVSAFFPSRSL